MKIREPNGSYNEVTPEELAALQKERERQKYEDNLRKEINARKWANAKTHLSAIGVTTAAVAGVFTTLASTIWFLRTLFDSSMAGDRMVSVLLLLVSLPVVVLSVRFIYNDIVDDEVAASMEKYDAHQEKESTANKTRVLASWGITRDHENPYAQWK